MSNYRNTEDSTSSSQASSRTSNVRSRYFQTEYPLSCQCGSSDFEQSTNSRTTDISPQQRSDSESMKFEDITRKKVSISVQAGRNIVGKDDSLPKERKRWIRPPAVGQASSNDSNVILPICETLVSSDSEEELHTKLPNERVSAGTTVETDDQCKRDNVSEKTMDGSSDQSLPTGGDLSDFQQRIPTPSSVSSVTSRPLEWDSGADVGYYQQYNAVQPSVQELSSIERIALNQSRSGILVRAEPEGKSSSKTTQRNTTVINMIGAPTSESTPISYTNQASCSSRSMKSIIRQTNITFEKKMNGAKRYPHLFPEVIIQNKDNHSDSSIDGNVEPTKFGESHASPPKKSSSLENLNEIKLPEHQLATFPRSHSQINLIDETNSICNPHFKKISNPPQSLSSSSLATVVTGSPYRTSKFVQTSNHKMNVGTQSSLNAQSHLEKSESYKRNEQNNSSTLESVQMSADDRVNSFEYLPGHVYENAQKTEEQQVPWENGGMSLREDVERGVHLLEEFIQGSNANNTLMKKELIQRVVKRLIQADYPEDQESQSSLPLRCSTRRSQNRDEAIGESSSENVPPGTKPAENSTSLSGHSSSLWHSVTESSKSSDPSEPKGARKKSADPTTKKNFEEKQRPKSTSDYTSDTKSDWKAPTTKAEKLYENRRKGVKFDGNNDKLLDFLNFERENQLHWIVKEIDHLSNLKSLLEKHEKLRRNIQRLKKERQEEGKTDGKHVSSQRISGLRRRPLSGVENRVSANVRNSHPPGAKPAQDESWDSHNYDTSDGSKLRKTVSTETRKEDIFGVKRATSYTITLEELPKPKKSASAPVVKKPLIADRQTLVKESREFIKENYHLPTLQDYLLAKRPEIVARAEIRRKTVAELAAVRQLRQQKRPVLLAAAISGEAIPAPPPTLVKRVVSQKEMREQTEKKYRQTYEVKKKVSQKKLQESLKTNRLMADIYNKRLQLLTLKGHTYLSNSVDVISAV